MNKQMEHNSAVISELEAKNAKLRKEYDKEYLSKLNVIQHEGELIELNHDLLAENAKLRETLREAATEMCKAYCARAVCEPCPKEGGDCFVMKLYSVLSKESGDEEK